MLEQRIKEELDTNPALEEGAEQDELDGLDKNNNEEIPATTSPTAIAIRRLPGRSI